METKDEVSTITEEQRDSRSRGLGGSDIGPMLGLSKWKTPVQLYQEKAGLVPAEPVTGDAALFGILLEDVVAREFMRRTGKKVRRKNQTQVHKEHDFLLANIDRDVVGERSGLEVKTTSAWLQQEWGEEGSDDVPLYYLTQCAHYMEVMNYDRWYLAVLIGGQEFRWFQIERDVMVASNLIDRCKEFWQMVQDKKPPPPLTPEDLQRLYPVDDGGTVLATDEAFGWLGKRTELVDQKKKIEGKIDVVTMLLKDFVGDRAALIGSTGDKLATWKHHTQTRLDSKAIKKRFPKAAKKYSNTTDVRPFRVIT
ncbi:MAG: YqaJ viral recombinase family protein [Hyphomicrobium sp.]